MSTPSANFNATSQYDPIKQSFDPDQVALITHTYQHTSDTSYPKQIVGIYLCPPISGTIKEIDLSGKNLASNAPDIEVIFDPANTPESPEQAFSEAQTYIKELIAGCDENALHTLDLGKDFLSCNAIINRNALGHNPETMITIKPGWLESHAQNHVGDGSHSGAVQLPLLNNGIPQFSLLLPLDIFPKAGRANAARQISKSLANALNPSAANPKITNFPTPPDEAAI
jgi:hypothetical protein